MISIRPCVVYLLFCVQPFAAWGQTQVESYSISVPSQSTNYSASATVPRFAPSRGILQSVELEATADLAGSAAFESQDAMPANITLNFSCEVAVTSSGSLLALADPTDVQMVSVTAFDGTIDFGGTSGAMFPSLMATETTTATYAAASPEAALFLGSGEADVNTDVTGTSSGSGGGNLILQIASFVSVELEVRYLFLPDCNQNGVPDGDDISSGASVDSDLDSIPDECGGTGTHFCLGTGTCTGCPCGNDAVSGTVGGCLNSSGAGARLHGLNSTSVTAADLRLQLQNAPPGAFAVLFSGTDRAPVSPTHPCAGQATGVISPVFDGLRCAVGGVLRHGSRAIAADGTVGVTTGGWGPPNGPPGGLLDHSGTAVGQTRYFQVVLRDDPLAICGTGQNTSQGLAITAEP